LFVPVPETPVIPAAKAFVFPNPARHVAYVALSPPPVTPVNWQLFDLSGRQVATGAGQGDALLEIPLSGLAGGLYFLRFPGSRFPSLRLVVID
jgi:hypothetical protein